MTLRTDLEGVGLSSAEARVLANSAWPQPAQSRLNEWAASSSGAFDISRRQYERAWSVLEESHEGADPTPNPGDLDADPSGGGGLHNSTETDSATDADSNGSNSGGLASNVDVGKSGIDPALLAVAALVVAGLLWGGFS